MRVRFLLSATLLSLVSTLTQAAPLVYCKVEAKVDEASIEGKEFTFDRHQPTDIRGWLAISDVDYLIKIENGMVAALLTNRKDQTASLSSDRMIREHGYGKMDVPLHLTNTLQVRAAPNSTDLRKITLWCVERESVIVERGATVVER